MVKACSSPRTAHALAAKVEVVRKSLAARRAGSIPASGTNKEAAPHQRGGFFLELSNADRFGLPVACLRCRVVLRTFGSTSRCWMARDCVDGSVANAYPPACSNRSAFRKTLRQAGALAFARQLALLRLIGPVRVVVGIDRIFLRWLRRIRIFL